MSRNPAKTVKPEAAALSEAFVALDQYDQGSSRAALLPIDEAVAAALNDKTARKELEHQLTRALTSDTSAVAREYVCSKLSLIGSKSCVPALAGLLDVREVATAARNALEVIPDRRAAEALRQSLPKLPGPRKIGVINSLGARRDAASVRSLSSLLRDADEKTAAAAAAALAEIATAKAAKALKTFFAGAAPALQLSTAHALLICAEWQSAAGRKAEAAALYRVLTTAPQPKHVQQAAAKGLARVSAKRCAPASIPSLRGLAAGE